MDGTEPPLQIPAGTGGYRDQQQSVVALGGGPEGAGQGPAKAPAELVLAVPFEGQQRLGKLVPVDTGGHHGQQGRTDDVHQGRGAGLRAEGPAGQVPDSAGAGRTQGAVFRAAAHTVNGNRQRQEISCRICQPIEKPKEGSLVFAPVQCRAEWGRPQVGVQFPGTQGSPRRLSRRLSWTCSAECTVHGSTVPAGVLHSAVPAALCGKGRVDTSPGSCTRRWGAPAVASARECRVDWTLDLGGPAVAQPLEDPLP